MRRQLSRAPYGSLVLQEMIGKGSYGQIYKAYADSQNKNYAVKVITSDSESDFLMNIYRQIKILTSCNHANIVKCYGVQVVDEMVWIVMDYYAQGSLADVMARQKRTFSEQEIQSIVLQVLKALAYLHARNVIHRDIKAANVLVDNHAQIKVADFGVSTLVSQSNKHTRTGSPLWMSPELLSDSIYSYKTDIWSLGITALELAEGVPPYSHQHPYRAIFSIQSHPPCSLTEPWRWSEQFNSFVSKCLTLDEKKRPSATDLLNHQFITKDYTDCKSGNSTNLLSTKAMRKSDFNSGNKENSESGTVIMHSSVNSSVWDESMNNTVLTHTQEEQDNSCETFKMKSKENPNMSSCLLAEITKKMGLSVHDINRDIKKQKSVQSLYLEMEQEIMKIRKKYMKKIKSLQQKTTMTFEQELKKSKFRGN